MAKKKKIYMKETRNEAGEFYRRGDWGIERDNNWDNGKNNWTKISPPDECLDEVNPVECDWDETSQSWITGEKTLPESTTEVKISPETESELDTFITKYPEAAFLKKIFKG